MPLEARRTQHAILVCWKAKHLQLLVPPRTAPEATREAWHLSGQLGVMFARCKTSSYVARHSPLSVPFMASFAAVRNKSSDHSLSCRNSVSLPQLRIVANASHKPPSGVRDRSHLLPRSKSPFRLASRIACGNSATPVHLPDQHHGDDLVPTRALGANSQAVVSDARFRDFQRRYV